MVGAKLKKSAQTRSTGAPASTSRALATAAGEKSRAVTIQCTLIYERAFLCALPRKLWADWGRRVAELLPPGGLLAGYFFVCDQPKGPPFGILPEQLDELLTPNFERLADAPASDSIAVFAGRERWQVWRRRASGEPAA